MGSETERPSFRALLLVSAVLVLPALAVGPAKSLELPHLTESSRASAGNYKFFTRNVMVAKNETDILYFRVRNNTNRDLDMAFTDQSTAELARGKLAVTWYLGRKQRKNIDADVESDGFEFTLKEGLTRYFNVRVRSLNGDGICLAGESLGDGQKSAAYIGINGDDCSG